MEHWTYEQAKSYITDPKHLDKYRRLIEDLKRNKILQSRCFKLLSEHTEGDLYIYLNETSRMLVREDYRINGTMTWLENQYNK